MNIIDEDYLDTRKINKSTKEISNNLNKFNKFFENSEEIYLNHDSEGNLPKIIFIKKKEIKNLDPSDSSEDLKKGNNLEKEIQKIKDLRNKKRQVQHTDETYDQDYVEIKNIKTDVLLNGIVF